MKNIRVIGVPRSGTNLMKALVDMSAPRVNCKFNVGWWKHAVIPPVMPRETAEKIPTVIMYRDPIRQLASFYTFMIRGRTAIISSKKNFIDFLDSSIDMVPPGDFMRYTYDSPAVYWLQFYRAALSWSDPVIFVDLHRLQADPHLTADMLRYLGCGDLLENNPVAPKGYLGRNADQHFAIEGYGTEAGMTLAGQNDEAEAAIRSAQPRLGLREDVKEMEAVYARLEADGRNLSSLVRGTR